MFKEAKAFSSFSVKDIPASKAFYGEVLGLDISAPMDQLSLNLTGGGKVFIYGKEDHQPALFTVLNFNVPELEKAMQHLSDQGVKFEIYKEEGFATDDRGVHEDEGMKIAWFKDPSGNILSIIEEG
jgi:catechol 2,3-dioxygenase-like lactoylglutathione lyase family enzyme